MDRAKDSHHGLFHIVQCERVLEDAVVLAYEALRGFGNVKIVVLFPAKRPDSLCQETREGGVNTQLIRQFFRFERIRLRFHYPYFFLFNRVIRHIFPPERLFWQ